MEIVQKRDKEKQLLSSSHGISLLVVPFWWTGTIESIAQTLRNKRPDVIIPITFLKGDPIPEELPKRQGRRLVCVSINTYSLSKYNKNRKYASQSANFGLVRVLNGPLATLFHLLHDPDIARSPWIGIENRTTKASVAQDAAAVLNTAKPPKATKKRKFYFNLRKIKEANTESNMWGAVLQNMETSKQWFSTLT